jgi:polyribonucleotide nucleotidyltransferase
MHNFNIVKKQITLAGRELSVETGKIAKQANGSVFIQYGKTSLLVTATMAKEVGEETDFFPLTVDFIEKMYASGKFPGGFFKREAKPSTSATLTARLIDRAIRPLFPKGFRNAVHVVLTILSYDGINNPSSLGIFGASLALMVSDIPFHGPISGLTVGLFDGLIEINPLIEKMNSSALELEVAGTNSSIVMIEAGANEIKESTILDAIYKGHEIIKELNDFQSQYAKEAGKEKIAVTLDIIPEEIVSLFKQNYLIRLSEAANIQGKQERTNAVEDLKNAIMQELSEQDGEELFIQRKKHYGNAFEELFTDYIRKSIIKDHKRADGRTLDEIRPITCEIDILPIVHGSALFTRGETQALCTVTLGNDRDEQVVDGLAEEFKKQYFLHYNFPPYCVGEAGFMRPPGRRELGHGALGERALQPVIPAKSEFPYTLRLVSDIMESNGSSSMATVCAGTLALMAAGVPIKAPVAGIANGLILEGDKFVVLTDIMGLEDHLGDMDFKVTGTKEGITAVQMDIKIEGISREIMESALEKALQARLSILDNMKKTISEPRTEIADTAPRIEKIQINPEKIGEVIGSGGKMIKQIIERTKVDINIEDDGTVSIASPNKEHIEYAKQIIKDITTPPEMDKIYKGKVKRVEVYGAFVSFMSDTKDGLVHISQLHNSHVKDVGDLVKVGDEVLVKFIGSDRGKIKLSMKGIDGNPGPSKK